MSKRDEAALLLSKMVNERLGTAVPVVDAIIAAAVEAVSASGVKDLAYVDAYVAGMKCRIDALTEEQDKWATRARAAEDRLHIEPLTDAWQWLDSIRNVGDGTMVQFPFESLQAAVTDIMKERDEWKAAAKEMKEAAASIASEMAKTASKAYRDNEASAWSSLIACASRIRNL